MLRLQRSILQTINTLRLSFFSSSDCHGFYSLRVSPAKYKEWSSPSITHLSQKYHCNFFHPHSQQKDTSLHWGPRTWLFPPKENHYWEKAVNSNCFFFLSYGKKKRKQMHIQPIHFSGPTFPNSTLANILVLTCALKVKSFFYCHYSLINTLCIIMMCVMFVLY